MKEQDTAARVVIIGGGFAGLFAARALRGGPFSVPLIDRTAQHVFQPLLYQCATGILSEGQIHAPLRRVFRSHSNLDCITAKAVDVDVTKRTVTSSGRSATRSRFPTITSSSPPGSSSPTSVMTNSPCGRQA